jgi:hypothetical protein
LVARLTGGQEAVSSSLATRTISSVHNGFQFPYEHSIFFCLKTGVFHMAEAKLNAF